MSKNKANIDVVQAGDNGVSGSGLVAQKLLEKNFAVEALRTQDVLRKDEWQKFDEVIIDVARKRLTAVGDLLSRGLTYPLPNALGVTQVEWEQAGDLTDATVSMGGITHAERDRQTFTQKTIPVPIVHKDFQINVRALEASRTRGTPLDTAQAALAARIVSEKIESILFNGSVVAGTSNQIYGYTTHPDRVTGSLGTAWTTETGANILADVLAMITAANAQNMYGPFIIYVPVAAHVNMGNDFKSESDKTILQRILEVPTIAGVQHSTDLAAGEVVMVQLTSDVVDMVDGIQPTVVQWTTEGGFMLNFKVLSIMVPRIKSDKSGQSGVIHYS